MRRFVPRPAYRRLAAPSPASRDGAAERGDMLLTVVGLGANIASALLLAHRRGSSPIAGIPGIRRSSCPAASSSTSFPGNPDYGPLPTPTCGTRAPAPSGCARSSRSSSATPPPSAATRAASRSRCCSPRLLPSGTRARAVHLQPDGVDAPHHGRRSAPADHDRRPLEVSRHGRALGPRRRDRLHLHHLHAAFHRRDAGVRRGGAAGGAGPGLVPCRSLDA